MTTESFKDHILSSHVSIGNNTPMNISKLDEFPSVWSVVAIRSTPADCVHNATQTNCIYMEITE